jgi:hypothetical protein
MTCIKCDKDIAECTCPDAAERIREILSVVVFSEDYARRVVRHLNELEGQQQLRDVGKQ